MSWRDKDEFGDPTSFGPVRGSGSGSGSSWWRRTFFRGDNPIRWGVPLFRFRGILVQVSWLFVIYAVARLASEMFSPSLVHVALAVSSLFILVLLHEFGHCFACRWVGGEADDILMWPLGGLAFCRPPHNWRAAFITTAGGPLVNVALAPLLAAATYFISEGRAPLLFNPFSPFVAGGWYTSLPSGDSAELYLKVWVWWLYYTNTVLLIFNLVVPMFPMDGARLVQELLWRKLGYRRSMLIATTVGLATAVVLGIIAMVATKEAGVTLLGLAIFGGITCWNERRQLTAAREIADDPYGLFLGRGAEEEEDDEPVAAPARRNRAADQAQREQEEVDRILAKIAKEGMASLSRKERKTLEGATKRQRGS